MIGAALLLLAVLTPAEQFEAGNSAYETGDFAAALAHYDSVATSAPSAAVLFNRGNAHFKLGQTGRAIADYARANVLDPHDQDISHNLRFARAYRADKTTAIPNPLVRLLTGAARLLDLGLVRLLTGVLFLMVCTAFGLLFLRSERAWLWIGVGTGLACLYAAGSWLSWAAEVDPHRAVVVKPELTLRSGPGEDYKDIAVVHDGLEGTVRSRRGRYLLLQIPGGQGGWSDTSAVALVFPR